MRAKPSRACAGGASRVVGSSVAGMSRNSRLKFVSRGVLSLLGATAAAGLVAAHLLSGPSAYAASDDLVATGPEGGGSPHVRTFGPTGTPGGVDFTASGTAGSGAAVAAGDVTGDGVADIVTGAGPGAPSVVQVWSRDGKTLIASYNAFPGFTGGVNVATATVDATAGSEIIVGAGPGGAPHVKVLKLAGGQLNEMGSGFYAYDQHFTGGVFVAGAPGVAATGAGQGGGPNVRVFGLAATGAQTLQADWFAFIPEKFLGGVRVAIGDVTGDGGLELLAAAGPGGGPRVQTFTLNGTAFGPDFFAYDGAFRGGVWVATAGAVRNPSDRIITGAGAGADPHVRIWSATGNAIAPVGNGFYAYTAPFHGGVRVAGFPATPSGSTTTTAAGGSTTTAGGGATTTTAGGATTTTAGGATTTTAAGGTTTTAPCNGTRLPNGTCLPIGGTTTTAAG